MKALVTGGAGFIGSNLVNKLIKDGHEVIVIDKEFSKCHEQFYWNNQALNIKADVRDYKNTRKYYENVDWVFHLAAEARIQPAIHDSINAVDINMVGTAVTLQASLEAGVKKFIFASSSSIYGNNFPPNTERQPDKCLNVYSLSKSFGEKLCNIYWKLYGLQTISLRYFNVYGPNQPTKGEYAPVIGLWLKQLQNNQPLTVVGDGSQRRCFTHVDDVVKANILAATTELKRYGEIFNIGSPISYSIKEIAQAISPNITYLPKRPAEAQDTQAFCFKASDQLNWKAEINLMDWLNGT